MRILKFSAKYSAYLNKSDLFVSADIVAAVDEIVFEESYMFFKLLDDSGKILNFRCYKVITSQK